MSMLSRAAAMGTLLLVSACGGLQPNLVAVLPEADGHVGSVVVRPQNGDAIVLDQASAGAQGRGGTMSPIALPPPQVQEVFGRALAARPLPPRSFTLYFLEGREELTGESKPIFDEVFQEIGRRPVADIVVIGHTDRVGQLTDNDKLALRRATAMRDLLVARGIAAQTISTAGRGEREPLVATADDVAEPRNRRVEIAVR